MGPVRAGIGQLDPKPQPLPDGIHAVPQASPPRFAPVDDPDKPPCIDWKYYCKECDRTVPHGTWHAHLNCNQHAWMVRRNKMEADGTDGCTKPPPGTDMRRGFAWCGVCQTQAGIMGKDWPQHVNGHEHKRNAFKLKAAGKGTFAPKAKPKAARKGLAVG